jgi:predicted nucleic acid-binding protein
MLVRHISSETHIALKKLAGRARRLRYTLPITDGQIAAIASLNGFTAATRDVQPFIAAGVPVVNPWESVS